MKKVFDLFRRNLSLKLLALALAIVVYYSVRDALRAQPQRGDAPAPFLKGTSS